MEFNPTTANLLASEDLTVVQVAGKMASFDVKSRVLKVPVMDDKAYDVLLPHEVGHAKFTPSAFDAIFQKAPAILRGYYNILEDIRIEKLIKREYPGLRKSMAAGYAYLHSLNYLYPAGTNLDRLNFIDRVNIHFKAGAHVMINFTDEERALVDEASKTETWQDVKELAEKLYAFAREQEKQKQQEEHQKQQQQQQKSNGDSGKSESKSKSKEKDKNASSDKSEGKDKGSKSKEKSESQKSKGEDEDEGQSGNPTSESEDGEPQDSGGEPQEGDGSGGEGEGENDGNQTDSSDGNGENPGKGESGEDESEKSNHSPLGSEGGSGINPNDDFKFDESKLSSTIQERIDEGLSNLAQNVTIENYSMETEFADPFIPFETIYAKVKKDYEEFANYHSNSSSIPDTFEKELEQNAQAHEKFMESTTKVVNYMVKEFEMKKAAARLKHAQSSRTGRLDVNKLFAYKIKDDLFKSITVTRDEKNHGMIFLVDWSGSMSEVIADVLRQVVALAMFCRKVKIPFKVLAFQDSRVDTKMDASQQRNYESRIGAYPEGRLISGMGYDVFLLEFMNDSMTQNQFNKMSKLLFSSYLFRSYSMNGTPLNNSLVFMNDYIPKYKTKYNIEKMTFVVLTDGESGDLHCKAAGSSRNTKRIQSCYGSTVSNLADTVHKKSYKILPSDMTGTLLKAIASNAKCNVVGFYVCSQSSVQGGVRSNYKNMDPSSAYDLTNKIKDKFKTEGWAEAPDSNYSKLYFVKTSALQVVEVEANYSKRMSSANLAREMTKKMTSGIANRVLMSQIIKDFA